MIENRYKIRYDIKKFDVTDVKFKQGDADTSVIEVQLYDNDKKVDITGEEIEFRFLKPDKTTVWQDRTNGVNILDAANGIFECVLKAETLASVGQVFSEIVRMKGAKRLTSPLFSFGVEKSIGGMFLSSNYIVSFENKIIEWEMKENIRQATFDVNEAERIRLFNLLTATQQQDAEVVTARGTKESLKARLDDGDTKVAAIDTEVKNARKGKVNLLAKIDALELQSNENKTKFTTHNQASTKRHIRDSGTNVNGRYVLFEDGTLVCTKTVELDLSVVGNVDFVVAHNLMDSNVSVAITGGKSGDATILKSLSDLLVTSSWDGFRIEVRSTANFTRTIHATLIGRGAIL